MQFKVKINGGELKRHGGYYKLSHMKLNTLLKVEDFKDIKSEVDNKDQMFVTMPELDMRDNMAIHNAVRNNEPIKLIERTKRGFMNTLVFEVE